MKKVTEDPAAALSELRDGMSIAVGGFGPCGVPVTLIDAVRQRGTTDLHLVSNNCGIDDWGLSTLLTTRRVRWVTASYIGDNREFARQYLSGELNVELVPQGTLAERLRAGGAGIPAFYTPAGVGTQAAEGGIPIRYSPTGEVAEASPPKEVRTFAGRPHVLETAITTDFGLVHAAYGDRYGNLAFHASARNFNPLCAMAARVTVAEVEILVDVLPADEIHLPGVFVQHVVPVGEVDKRIEYLTFREEPERALDA